MPKPLPEYVPPLVRERIRLKGYTGLSGLAAAADLPQTTVNKIFRDHSNRSLKAFHRFQERLKITEDRAIELLKMGHQGKTDELRAAFAEHDPSWSRGNNKYFYNVLEGNGGGPILDTYLPLSRALDLDLRTLSDQLDIQLVSAS